MIVALPTPNTFPVGSHVRAGEVRGQVIALRGPYSVVLRQPGGTHLVTTTADLILDDEVYAPAAPQPAPQPDLFSLT